MSKVFARVSDLVRDMIPRLRITMSSEEVALAAHVRGNEALYAALKSLILARIEGRATVPEPTDPLLCKSMVARDRELMWLLSRIDYVYRSPANTTAHDGEQPA